MAVRGTDVTARQRHIVMLGPFAMSPKATMSARALPLARELVARGHRVTLLVPPWDNPADSGKRSTQAGVEIVNITLPRRLRSTGIVHRVFTTVNQLRPDILHLFKPKGYSALAATGLARRWPLVLDTDDWEGPGGWNERGGYTLAQRAFFAWQERTVPRLARAVTVASRTLQTQMWGLGVPAAHVVYLPNGIDAEQVATWPANPAAVETRRADLGLPHAPTVLLYTRFVEFAPERAANLFVEVHSRIPSARLLLVGSGFRGEEAVFTAKLNRHGLARALTHVAWAPRARLAATLALGDVAILPYDDTLVNRAKCSVKSLDLMAAERAVVAEAVGQNTAYFEHNVSGVLIEPGAGACFVDSVSALLADREWRERLGAAAARRAVNEFNWSRLTDRVERLYTAIL